MSATSVIRLATSGPHTRFSYRILIALAVAAALLVLGGLTLVAANATSPDVAAPGSAAVSSYQISKSPKTPGAWKPAQQIEFTIQITNTGETWITTLPLRDVYSPTYLSYGHCGVRHTADPQPENYSDDGQLDWGDLTAAAPYGFGTDLAPGASFTIIVTLTAAADTSVLPGSATENRALVHGALADPDGSGGPLPEEPLPDQASSALVSIFVPTCSVRLVGDAQLASDGSPALQPTCSSSVGGRVWHDIDFNGEMDDVSEAGIDGALMNSYWDDGDYHFEPGAGDPFYQSAITATPWGAAPADQGTYDFALPSPSICEGPAIPVLWVEADPSNFAPGGVLENMVLTSEGTYGPLPALVSLPDWYTSLDYVSFGFNVAGSYTLVALGTQPDSQRVGQPISVSFRITNTGAGWITTLPLRKPL